MKSLDESHGQAILRILREGKRCLAGGEIAEKLNSEGQDTGWSNVLVDAEAARHSPNSMRSAENGASRTTQRS